MAKNRRLTEKDIEAILTGSSSSHGDLERLVEQMRILGEHAPTDSIRMNVVSEAAEAARLSQTVSAGQANRPAIPLITRRRIVFSSLMSGLVAKFMAGAIALAAVGSGAAVVANDAAPGEFMYGVDQAFEGAGIFDGGAVERLREVEHLFQNGEMERALEHARDALGGVENGYDEAVNAFTRTQEQVKLYGDSLEDGQMIQEQFRNQLIEQVQVMQQEMAKEQVNVQNVNQVANQIETAFQTQFGNAGHDTGSDGAGSGTDSGSGSGSADEAGTGGNNETPGGPNK